MATRRLPRDVEAAVAHWGPKANKVAERYNISGRSLLAKLTMGESGGRGNAVSSAGARGWFQFMPSSAAAARAKGADPYKSADQAAKAAVMHLRGVLGHNKGLEGYNPGGGQSYVRYILGQKVRVPGPGGAGGGGSSGGGADAGGVVGGSTQRSLPEPGGTGMADILAAALQRPRGPTVSAPPEPAYSARRALRMPQGYSPTQSAPAGPSQAQTVADAIQALSKVRGPGIAKSDSTATAAPGGESAGTAGAAAGGGKKGHVSIRPGADRAGVKTNRAVISMGRQIAGITGRSITLGTGSNHSRMTASGNVSHHWTGNAGDWPMAGAALTSAGQAALIAAGMPKSQARKARGGIYNVGDWQIIFNAPDHHDHLHTGFRG